MDMNITFPGNKKVDATYKGFTIHTDQPQNEGGDGSAAEPFSLFLASIGTCTGIYVHSFCQNRNIPTNGLSLTLKLTENQTSKLIEKITITIQTPQNFPARYKTALKKAANLCTVSRQLEQPPKIDVSIQDH